MHDFKYWAVLVGQSFWKARMTELQSIRSGELRPVVEAFIANFMRTSSFAATPAQIAYKVRRDQVLSDFALFKVTGKLDEPDISQFDRPTTKEYRDAFESQAVRFFGSLTKEKESQLLGEWGIKYVETLLESSKGLQVSIEALLSAIILESWTAFESLASDMWVAAVDTGPRELRLRVANSNKLLKPDDSIGGKELFEAEFDPSKNYGSSLRELGRVSFQKLDYIKRFYSIAFEHDFNKMFSEEGGYILALSAFRNALIHAAGKADKHFIKQVSAFPDLRSIKLNDPLLLDGESVKKLQNASLSLVTRLVQFVDNVLTPETS